MGSVDTQKGEEEVPENEAAKGFIHDSENKEETKTKLHLGEGEVPENEAAKGFIHDSENKEETKTKLHLGEGEVPENEAAKGFIHDSENKEKTNTKLRLVIIAVLSVVAIGIVILIIVLSVVLTRPGGLTQKEGLFGILDGEINFIPKEPGSYSSQVSLLNKYMEKYKASEKGGNVIQCSDTNPPNATHSCWFDANWVYDVCPEDSWNFDTSLPCVLLSFNGDPDFVPVPYETEDDLPKGMDEELRDYILEEMDTNEFMPKMAWIKCSHGHSYSLQGRGFPVYSFQYKSSSNYLQPIVAVRLDLKGMENKKTEIKCRLWAKNIDQNPRFSFNFSVTVNSP